jgi:acyl transferase domain-containing protein/acyl-CoA synthetase (AMP-forming)/AMP-acid ligase II/acyl carrier protein
LSKDISASRLEHSTLVELLRWRATYYADKRAYSFLNDGEVEKDHLTFAQLDRQARIISLLLQQYGKTGERVLLIYPSGLEFIAAFFGCLYSGVIAVPVYPPSTARADRSLIRFRAIANDAQPSIILTTASLAAKVEGLLALAPELQEKRVLITSALSTDGEEQWQRPSITSDTLAFLQYTSGSTGTPKGVMVSHSNLLHNLSFIGTAYQSPPDAHAVTWLPLYHDMGLIGGILQPFYDGYESTILSPTAFLQRPIRWLQAISRTRATFSGGPNFAYDLCVRKITAEQKATLDLSSWQTAASGAEPIHVETLERFTAAFAPCGFRREAFFPCYGLAEATLFVCGRQSATVRSFERKALEQDKAVGASFMMPSPEEKDTHALVSFGPPLPDQELVIVDTATFTRCEPGQVGEIWLAGGSVAQGYWQHTEETEQTFQAYLADTREGPFLRTGDLGFLYDGELFIAGRLKDLIIIRGNNHYPQDIELTVAQSHPALRAGGGVAFSIDVDGEERLVVVQEVERQYLRADMTEVVGSIRQAIAEQHELQVYAVVLIKPGSMLKTSSGKIQRRACRESFLAKDLNVVYEWRLDLAAASPLMMEKEGSTEEDEGQQEHSYLRETRTQETLPSSPSEPKASPARGVDGLSREAIQSWLVTQIAERLKVNLRDVDVRTPFAHYGMDSVHAVSLAADLEEWLGCELSPTLAYDYPTIEALAQYLAGEPSLSEGVSREQEDRKRNTDAIAIIGMGCRFPGAQDPESFWQLLQNGKDGITEVPPDRWDVHSFYDPERATPGKMNTRWGGFLSHIDQFDPSFFGISPREAARMDPQQRLLLEVAWEAFEHAGQAADQLAGSQTGVFIGISSNDYAQLQYSDPRLLDPYSGTGNAHSIAANRLSYLLDLRGPSMAIDTACSSSLVAVHMACQSLRTGECDMALAGGVNLLLSPELTITFSQANMLSADGRCKTFDDDADGYVRAEGCGMVVLRPLSKALEEGDRVLAVIRGSAVNQDGRSNGLTAPNGLAQEAVIRQALAHANVSPDQISYVETHGSSTPLGDPIEFSSLKAVLMQERSPDQPCVLGSVKTNIGHLEAAAGIAGLIKTVLSLEKGEIPPHLHLKKLNRHISFDETTFIIPHERMLWPTEKPRFAGVSAFGFGGTNVHVILEEAARRDRMYRVRPDRIDSVRPLHVLALSAKSETALHTLAAQYAAFLATHPTESVADICFTANAGRSHFAHRLAVTANSSAQLQERLAAFAAGQTHHDVQYGYPGSTGRGHNNKRRQIAFLFTGQGSQYFGMARQLYMTEPTFRQALDRCNQLLRTELVQPLLSVLYPEPGVTAPLHETAYTQPALFALEYALAELWRSWGIEPDVVMGHSVGEYVAAYVVGAFSLEEGLHLIAERGRLMQALPKPGAMAAVFADQGRVEAALSSWQGRVAVAAINGAQHTVISGEREAVQAVQRQLEAEGVMSYPLVVSHAFHSPLMDPVLDAFEQTARQLHFKPLRIPLISNLTGKMVRAGETLDATYWRRQTREAVQFADGMHTLAEHSYEVFLELGPTSTLLSMGRQALKEEKGTWLPSLQKDQDEWETLLHALGTLYVKGAKVDWSGFEGSRGILSDALRRRVALPTYPFERERYWIETTEGDRRGAGIRKDAPTHQLPSKSKRHPLLDTHTELAHPIGNHVWETALDKHSLPYLNDHRIEGVMALPVSVYLEMAQAAAREALGAGPYVLTEIELKKLLLVPEQGVQKVQVVLSSEGKKQSSFHVYSHATGEDAQLHHVWTLHATGKILHD